ncbi:MAG: class I SAM-dependent methyltransferase [Myxococcales bacterium]|nr:class I SAM-dependent methyltransferase [Myxococcales bacterium]
MSAPRELTLLPPAIADYVHAHTTPEGELFARLRDETQADLAAPQMQVGRVEGAFLRLLVGIAGARSILEIGTYSGYSGLAMASALPDDGALVTCDVDPVATAVARRYFDESGHGHKIAIRLGPAIETIAELAAAGRRFDLVFIDADKESYGAYWEAVLPLVPVGGLIVADNTLWSGKVLDPQEASDHAIVAFNRQVAADPRVEQVLLSIRDGVMLARKRSD